MRTLITLLAVLLLMAGGYLMAQENNNSGKPENTKKEAAKLPKELSDKCTEFFNKIIKLDIENAFRDILKKSPLLEKSDQVSSLVQAMKDANQYYGTMKGYEPVDAHYITPSMIRARYLGLHKDFPTRWLITFYKSPDNGWIVVNIKFDDDMEELFSGE